MSAERPEAGKYYLLMVAAGLVTYSIVLTVITGDIGFNGDDWWVLAIPYWNGFPESLISYAQKFLRPVEGVYWIGLFEIFGFNRIVFHICSLLLLALSAALMGVALDRAFPGRRNCISLAVLLAFFLPPVSCLTYVLFTDNSRLSMVFFWGCVIAFQAWARASCPWRKLILPSLLYVISFLTYETSSFLIFAVPLLVWPVHRSASDRISDRAFLTRMCAGIAIPFVAAVAMRFFFLKGGAVGQTSFVPPWELVWSYLALLPLYLLAPFTSLSTDQWGLAAGLLVMAGAAAFFSFARPERSRAAAGIDGRFSPSSWWYIALVGTAILFLGMLPYQLAGYGSSTPRMLETVMTKYGLLPGGDLSWFNFSWSSRIFSSASFGVAILLAVALTGWKSRRARILAKALTVAVIGCMAVFHAGLSLDWREAADMRNDLVRSLVSQVPAVKPGTNFVFLDVACSHKRAEVIRRENGLRELVGMLYADPTLGAWRAYSRAYDPSTHAFQQSIAMPEGFLCRSQRQGEPAPPQSLLIFKRTGRELVLQEEIAAKDNSIPTGIEWRGVDHLASNLDRIEAWSSPFSPESRIARAAWKSGLISTLHLTLFRSTRLSFRTPKYVSFREALRRRLFKMSLYRAKIRL